MIIFEEKISLEKLPEFCEKLAQEISSGDCVCLSGEIGSGKTTFLYHFLKTLGMEEDVDFSSPTFTIHHIYKIKEKIFHHIDLYRLGNFSELETLDLIPFFQSSQDVVFVEWGDKFKELQPLYNKKINFFYLPGENNSRLISYDVSRSHLKKGL